MQAMTLTSSAFTQNSPIPKRYTCDGEDISPPLAWSGAPGGTGSLVLICDDPDAPMGNWDHWILFNIPAGTAGLPEHFMLGTSVLPGVRGGTNDFRRLDYGGPCPPGGVHRYFFKVYALDILLELKEGIRKQELLSAMEGHILAKGELVGTYTRKR